MKCLVASSLIATTLLSVTTLLAEDKPAPTATAAAAADKTETKPAPAVAEPAKPAAPAAPHKLEVMQPQFAQFASLVRFADANGDMIIDDQEADAAIKALGHTMRDQFKRRNQAILNKYDLDKDGRLSAEELLKMKELFRESAAKARRPVTRPQINAMTPADGKLTPKMETATRPGPFKADSIPVAKPETKAEPPAAAPAPAK